MSLAGLDTAVALQLLFGQDAIEVPCLSRGECRLTYTPEQITLLGAKANQNRTPIASPGGGLVNRGSTVRKHVNKSTSRCNPIQEPYEHKRIIQHLSKRRFQGICEATQTTKTGPACGHFGPEHLPGDQKGIRPRLLMGTIGSLVIRRFWGDCPA